MRKQNIFKKLMFLFAVLLFTGTTYGQTYFTEFFEGAWTGTLPAPAGWTQTHPAGTDTETWEKSVWSGTAWAPAGNGIKPTGTAFGTAVAHFNDYNSSNGNIFRMESPVIDLSTSTGTLLDFSYFYNSGSAMLKFYASSDGGTNWTNVSGNITATGSVWQTFSYDITAYKSATTKIAFEVVSAYGLHDLWLDNIVVREKVVPAAPINFSTTLVAQTSMTLNWEDNSTNETGFRVYYSIDNLFFLKYGTDITSTSVATTGTAYNQSLTSLLPGTTYYFRVVAYTDLESTNLTGSQATNAPGDITSQAAGGLWSASTTWVGGSVPTAGDNVTITDAATVTLDVAGFCNNITVGQGVSGILEMNAFTLTAGNNVTIATGGAINVAAGTTANLTVKGNLTNNGTLDLWNTSAIYGKLSFAGFTNATFTLNSGSTSDFNTGTTSGIEINKGSNISSVLDFVYNGGTVNIAGSGTYTNGFFYITNGNLKVSGSGTIEIPLFSTAGPTIPLTGGVWLNNANFTVKGQSGTVANNGKIQLTDGIFNVGTATGNSLTLGAGSTVVIEGGTLNTAGRLSVASASNTNNYTQTGGIVNVCSVSQTSSTYYSFDLGTSTSSVFNMSGGTINILKGSTTTWIGGYDYRTHLGTANITGGTLKIGSSANVAGCTYKILGQTPTIIVDATNNPNVTLAGNTYVLGDLTMNGTGTFSVSTAYALVMLGMDATYPGNIVNNGTMTFNLGSTGQLYFAGDAGNQVFTNNGTITGNAVPILSIENTFLNGTVTIPAITVKNGASLSGTLNLYEGTLVCPTLTLGGGAAGTGGFNCNMTGGALQNTPTFDFGSGTVTYTYNATTAQTTGVELPASLTNTLKTNKIVINNAAGVTLNSPLSIDKLTLTSGNLTTTSTNLLTLTNTTTTAITQTSGYVNGPIALTLPASLATGSTYNFPIGKGISNKLELVNPTTDAGGTVVIKAEAFDTDCGGTAGTDLASINTNRYWETSFVSGQANFINTTVRLTETTPTLNSTYSIGQAATKTGAYNIVASTLGSNTLTTEAITNLGFFAIGVKSTPTITATPATLAFGYCASGATSVEKSYVLSGLNLVPADGNLTVTAPTDFMASLTAGGPYSSTINVPYTSGTLANTTIYVVFKPTTPDVPYTGNITNTGGSFTGTAEVAVTGTSLLVYCTPAPTSVDGTGITNVTMGTINNTTVAETNNYGDYSAQVTDVEKGFSFPISITLKTGYTYDLYAWVDLNINGSFTDAGETFVLGTSTNANPTTFNASITIPAGTSLGNHRIRIAGFDEGDNNPCYTGTFATFEDYTLNIVNPVYNTYTSSNSTQDVTSNITLASTNQQIIGIEVVTGGTGHALNLTNFKVNANGTTEVADISNAKIFYTGTSSTFATTTQFGSTFAAPTVAEFNITGSQDLALGTNYFWLTYDITSTPVTSHVVDAECTEITIAGSNYVPTTTAPTGSRPIISDNVPPTITSASVENAAPTVVVVNFSENVVITNTNGITISVGGTNATINSFAGNNTSTLTFTLAAPVTSHQVVTFSYSSATGTITDVLANLLGDYTDQAVTNNVVSSAKDFLTFGFTQALNPTLAGDITGVIGTNAVNISLPVGTVVNPLIATFTTSNYVVDVKISTDVQTSGVTSNDFTTSKTYIITAEDGTTKTYTVSIKFVYPIPYLQDFETATNLTTIGWSGGFFVGAHGTGTTPSKAIYKNLWSSATTVNATTVAVGTVGTTTKLSFDYRLINYTGYTGAQFPTPIVAGDKMEMFVSTDYGTTFGPAILVYDNTTHVVTTAFANKIFDLSAYNGQNVVVKLVGTWAAGDYYLDIDNFSIFNPTVPTVTTSAISTVTADGFTSGGNITANGGEVVDASGILYSSIDATPEFGEADVTALATSPTTTSGEFTSVVTGLTTGTPYYTRAYAHNAIGYAYGDILTVTPSSIDMGALELVSPIADAGCYGANQTVTVKIKNYSSVDIDFSVNPVTVSCDVIFNTVTTPFTNVVLNTGTLAAGATQDVIFSTTFDMSANGTYTFNASTTVAGDGITTNDEMTATDVNYLIIGGIYTVGATGDFATLTEASEYLNAATCITDDVVFSLIDADYSTNETFPIVIESTILDADHTLTIKPATGVIATITNATTTSILKLNGADYVIIDGSNNGTDSRDLTVSNTNTVLSTVIWIGSASASNGATDNTIKNCNLRGNSPITTTACILSGSGTTLGNSAESPNSDNTIENNSFGATQNGIFYAGNVTTPDENVKILNNTFGSSDVALKHAYRGILVKDVKDFEITGNTIIGVVTTSTSTTTGIQISASINGGKILNNVITDIKNTNTTGYGCNGIYLGSTSTTANILIANNFISDVAAYGYDGTSSADNGYGIFVYGGAGYNIYNNTVLMNTDQTATTGLTAALNIAATVTTAGALDIRNNIFANTQTTGAERFAIICKAPNTVFTDIDYNDYFASGTNLGYFGTANVLDLAAWKIATGKDANSLNVLPVFESATDLHLVVDMNCELSDMGTPIASVMYDIDGDARDASTPDMGADEFDLMIVNASVSDLSTSGFTLTLSPAIDGLDASYLTLDPSVTITSATTTDGGNTYTVAATLSQAVDYTLTVDVCYNINQPTFTIQSTYDVTFGVIGGNGDLDATDDGNSITSPAVVDANSNIEFTAVPDPGYIVYEWTINNEVVAGNVSNTLEINGISQDADVTVEFELATVPTAGTLTFVTTDLGETEVTAVNNVYDLGDICSSDMLNSLTIQVTDDNINTANVDVMYEGDDFANMVYNPTTELWVFQPQSAFNWSDGLNTLTTTFIDLDGHELDITVNFNYVTCATTYAVTFSVVGSNGTLAATVNSSAITSPATVAAGSEVVFTATPDANYQVKEWKLNNVAVAGNTSNNYTISSLQANATVTVEFEIIDGINELNSSVNIYPNPSNGIVNVTVEENCTLKVVDLTGKVLISREMNSNVNTIDMSRYANGIYNFILSNENGIRTFKVFVQQ